MEQKTAKLYLSAPFIENIDIETKAGKENK